MRRAGEGYSDILVEMEEKRIGIIIEIKYPDNGNLEAGCQKGSGTNREEKLYRTAFGRWYGNDFKLWPGLLEEEMQGMRAEGRTEGKWKHQNRKLKKQGRC